MGKMHSTSISPPPFFYKVRLAHKKYETKIEEKEEKKIKSTLPIDPFHVLSKCI